MRHNHKTVDDLLFESRTSNGDYYEDQPDYLQLLIDSLESNTREVEDESGDSDGVV